MQQANEKKTAYLSGPVDEELSSAGRHVSLKRQTGAVTPDHTRQVFQLFNSSKSRCLTTLCLNDGWNNTASNPATPVLHKKLLLSATHFRDSKNILGPLSYVVIFVVTVPIQLLNRTIANIFDGIAHIGSVGVFLCLYPDHFAQAAFECEVQVFIFFSLNQPQECVYFLRLAGCNQLVKRVWTRQIKNQSVFHKGNAFGVLQSSVHAEWGASSSLRMVYISIQGLCSKTLDCHFSAGLTRVLACLLTKHSMCSGGWQSIAEVHVNRVSHPCHVATRRRRVQ